MGLAVTIHIVGFPHTETTREFEFCAYTAKMRKLATMLTRAGMEVILYSGEANEAQCAEHVVIVTREEQRRWFPDWDHSRQVFNGFNADDEWWTVANTRAADEIRKRAKPGDILSIGMGISQQSVANALKDEDLLVVETGVGYSGVFAPYRIFESWAWRHYMASREKLDTIRFYDTVIPNFFEAEAFPEGKGDGGYYLFIGRMIERKGPHIAAEACKRIGAKLIVAGQCVDRAEPGRITCLDGTVLEGDVEYAGLVGPEERARLMGGAIAVFVPTLYLEPFGGVSVEAQMCGTPAIVSNWGGLIENVVEGATGFRCSTLAEFVAAAKKADSLDRRDIRDHARATWSTDVIAPQYAAYFDHLNTLYGDGWYSL